MQKVPKSFSHFHYFLWWFNFRKNICHCLLYTHFVLSLLHFLRRVDRSRTRWMEF